MWVSYLFIASKLLSIYPSCPLLTWNKTYCSPVPAPFYVSLSRSILTYKVGCLSRSSCLDDILTSIRQSKSLSFGKDVKLS